MGREKLGACGVRRREYAAYIDMTKEVAERRSVLKLLLTTKGE